jgi:tRNA(fMet)-specific endonuclease VapC
MLDTNTVSDIVRGRSEAARFKSLHLLPDEIMCVSAITEGELLYGLSRNPSATRLHAGVKGFLTFTQIFPWGREEAAVYGDLRAKHQAGGKPLAAMDLLIAAHAISVGAVLVSRDKVFAQVKDLPGTVNWATDLEQL